MNFDQFGFKNPIRAAIEDAGYAIPTPIQRQAIPVILQGRDIVGLAPTGTGKTAAFVLPILQRLGGAVPKKPRVLILEPTRELAEQVHRAIVSLSGTDRVRSVSIYGGVKIHSQLTALRKGVEIVVACPGRLLDHVQSGSMDISSVETFVLDEADRMCDMGFLPDIRRILACLPEKRQTLFFSATMPGDIRRLASGILNDPVDVQSGNMAPVETVSHALYPTSEGLKIKLLVTLLEKHTEGRVLVFTRTKHRTSRLAASLKKEGFRVSSLQGDMSQNHRQASIEGFRTGEYDILVATDIAARGIDILEITHVINYDMPDTADAYTHRIGRTGRAKRAGEAHTFIVGKDELLVFQIEKSLGKRIERCQLPGLEVPHFRPAALPLNAQPMRRRFRLSVAGKKRRIRAQRCP
ncbi:MAG: DEAD/DEAH box helicase [Acidobacteria bacterium]|nr:DEAD/DEAH box helicase [Acidobacteriota bacterium]